MMNGRRSVLKPTMAGFTFLVALAFISGCASQKIETLSQKLADQQRQLSALQRENIEMKSRLEEEKTASYLVDKRLKENNDRMADIQGRLQSVEIGLGEMKASLDEMKAISAGPGAAGRAATTVPPGPPTEVSSAEGQPAAAEPSTAISPPEKEAQPGAAPSAGALGSQELYDNAKKLLDAGQPGQAILEFEKYIREYPQSELAGNSQYWIGEAYYSKKEFSRAATEFQKVIQNYPRGGKVPDAHLKLGLSYLEMGQKEKGTAELKRLIAKYPKSAAASLARKKLAERSKSK
jgi:tol-pal system protein YbgF